MMNGDEKYGSFLEKLLDEIGICSDTLLKKESELKKYTLKFHKEPGNALDSIQESLDDLRLCVKYLLFDLDATRRENIYFKKLLEDRES